MHLGTGEENRHDVNLFDLSGVEEHVYRNIDEPTRKKVRVNLIVEGMTGNCATVRHVTVSPPPNGAPPALPRFVLQSITRPGAAAESVLATDVPNNRFTLTFAAVRDFNCMVYSFKISDGSLRAVTATISNGSTSGSYNNSWGNGTTGADFSQLAGPVMMTSLSSNTDNLFRSFFSASNVHHFLDLDGTASGAVTITLSAPGVQPLTITGVLNP